MICVSSRKFYKYKQLSEIRLLSGHSIYGKSEGKLPVPLTLPLPMYLTGST